MVTQEDDTQPKSDKIIMPVILAIVDNFAVFNFDSLLASC